jgi:thiamine biosynthesis protein ThiI
MFEQALAQRVEALMGRHGELEIHRGQGRFFVMGGEPPGLAKELTEVFGVASVSPVIFVEPDLATLAEVCVNWAREAQGRGVKSFRVRARRADKRFALTSTELNREVGALVVEATGLAVDLEQPELTLGIEIGPKASFVFAETLPGSGGLPVGVAGEAILLLSGGIDSPVAGHLMQKRGVRLVAVHFHSAPYTSAASQEKVRQLATKLASRQGSLELHQIPFGPAQVAIRDSADESYRVIMYRRLMVRIAEVIARKRQTRALVTGDSLGQVASQTLENLACIEAATGLMVLRPLLGFDKAEVIARAKAIGTYDISILPHDDCCSLFTPRHPQTKGHLGRAKKFERRLELEELIEQAVEAATVEIIEA